MTNIKKAIVLILAILTILIFTNNTLASTIQPKNESGNNSNNSSISPANNSTGNNSNNSSNNTLSNNTTNRANNIANNMVRFITKYT